MALSMDDQPSYKFFCRICKKGFGCGRALGGHMRAHGIGEEAGHMDDDDPASDWEDKLGGTGGSPPSSKRMYALRTNTNRMRNCRTCENCRKEFISWKSFLEHGKCSPEDAESLVSSPGSNEEDANGQRGCGGWSKGKRSRRVMKLNCPSSEEEDLANCLVMLSSAKVLQSVTDTEESCASASKEDERQRAAAAAAAGTAAPRGLFECKACKKVFNSHQALGGHRASHKKVKGCFAAKLTDLEDDTAVDEVVTHEDLFLLSRSALLPLECPKRKSKVHECSICHRVFSSGQALGGHKRCHWVTSNSDISAPKFHHHHHHHDHPPQSSFFSRPEPLDLNLPAPIEDLPRKERPDPFHYDTGLSLHHHRSNDHLCDRSKIHNPHSGFTDDEADSKVKLARLSDLKDINIAGSSQWLQMGIGSSVNGVSDS